jgi:hypothetical protein
VGSELCIRDSARVNLAIGLVNMLNTEVDSSIRRYRARFCIGGRLFPLVGLWHPTSVAAL